MEKRSLFETQKNVLLTCGINRFGPKSPTIFVVPCGNNQKFVFSFNVVNVRAKDGLINPENACV